MMNVINKKAASNMLATFFVVLVALLFVTSFVSVPLVQASMKEMGTINGEVTAIDNVFNMGMFTLRSSQVGQYPNNTVNIFTTRDTKLNVCGSGPFPYLAVNQNAKVTYHEVAGVAVADTINEKC